MPFVFVYLSLGLNRRRIVIRVAVMVNFPRELYEKDVIFFATRI